MNIVYIYNYKDAKSTQQEIHKGYTENKKNSVCFCRPFVMIPCVSLAETSVIGNMKERVKEMKVFGCRLNFWNHIGHSLTSSKAKEGKRYDDIITI